MKKIKQGCSWKGIPLHLISNRNGTPIFNFVSEKLKDSDDLGLLGFDQENNISMHEKFTWANIASRIGLFPSVSAAKNSGWHIPIEDGYTEAFFSRSDGTPLFVFIVK